METGEKIKTLRKAQGITQKEMAEIIGVSTQTVAAYERNIVTGLSPDKVEALAKLLHTTPAYIVGWESKKESTQEGIKDIEIKIKVDSKELDEALEKARALNVALELANQRIQAIGGKK